MKIDEDTTTPTTTEDPVEVCRAVADELDNLPHLPLHSTADWLRDQTTALLHNVANDTTRSCR